jgi:nucleoside-diphosphate-sugar epimerase
MSLELSLMKKVIKSMKYINCEKIIFFSTSKVYGDNSFIFQQFDENSELSPKCFYGKAKAKCEETLIKKSSEHNYNYLIFRLPPVLLDDQKSALGKLLQIVKKGVPIPSFRIGDKNERSFLSYELLVHIISLVVSDIRNVNNNTLNLSDSSIMSIHDLLRKFGESVNKKPKIIYLPDFFFKTMMRVNRLQSVLSRLYGNFHLSNAKLKREFEVPDKF